MIQRNHVMSAHRLSDVRHSQLLGRFSLSSCTPRIACCGHHVNERRRTKVPVGRCAGGFTGTIGYVRAFQFAAGASGKAESDRQSM
jgi:hypothetical protein